MNNKMKIKKASNGYIVKSESWDVFVYKTLDEVFELMLLQYEGLSSSFSGDLYGKVQILRKTVKGKVFIEEGIEEENHE